MYLSCFVGRFFSCCRRYTLKEEKFTGRKCGGTSLPQENPHDICDFFFQQKFVSGLSRHFLPAIFNFFKKMFFLFFYLVSVHRGFCKVVICQVNVWHKQKKMVVIHQAINWHKKNKNHLNQIFFGSRSSRL